MNDANVPSSDGEKIEHREASPDWRIRAVTHLAADVPAAYPGGPSHKAGALVVQATAARDVRGNNIGFTTPSAVALALNLAMRASDQAQLRRAEVRESVAVSPFGSGTSVTHETTAALYDYFEHCMTALTFSFQALEAYCNEVISDKVTAQYLFKNRRGTRSFTASEVERCLSTEEKLGVVLPDLLDIPTPKGTRMWQDFARLKELRDATVHIKSRDSVPRVMKPSDLDEATLFVRFLDIDVASFPKAAVSLIAYLADRHVMFPWITYAVKVLGVQPKRPVTIQSKKSKAPRGKQRRAA
jgi:hypothetical protein